MKFVKKNEEPLDFINWRIYEHDRLEQLYNNGNSEVCWGELHSSLPNNPEEGIFYYSKRQLSSSLLEEQGFICAYCNRIIDNDNAKLNHFENLTDRMCSIEHLTSRNEDIRKTFDYQNLMVTCRGGEKVPKPRKTHCDNERGSKPIPFTPLLEACETEILYLQNGDIAGLTPRAEELIKILGLDIPKLEECRKNEIQKCIKEPQDDGTLIPLTKDKAIQRYEELTENKPFVEFCGAIISVLKHEFII